MTHGSTFSGIGAAEIAAAMLGWKNEFHCEINPFGRRILDYYFPKTKSYEDITKTDFSEWRGKINILTGGFPCQPFSYAGKRRGSQDDRYLWPYMLRCINQIKPDWFIGENVAGITTMVFPGKDVKVGSRADLFGEGDALIETHERYVLNDICEGLERAGYSVQPLLIPACAVGAPHRRDRVWIIAHRDAVSEDTMRCGQQERGNEVQGSKRMEWNAGTRSDERLCGRTSGTKMRLTNDTLGSGSGAQEPSGRIEGNGSNGLPQQSQRRSETERTDGLSSVQGYATDTESQCSDGHQSEQREHGELQSSQLGRGSGEDGSYLLPANRWRTFPTQSPVYRGNDGIPFDVDSLTIPWIKSKNKEDHFDTWKRETIKAYGNAIVVQVMYEIFQAIDKIEKQTLARE